MQRMLSAVSVQLVVVQAIVANHDQMEVSAANLFHNVFIDTSVYGRNPALSDTPKDTIIGVNV